MLQQQSLVLCWQGRLFFYVLARHTLHRSAGSAKFSIQLLLFALFRFVYCSINKFAVNGFEGVSGLKEFRSGYFELVLKLLYLRVHFFRCIFVVVIDFY